MCSDTFCLTVTDGSSCTYSECIDVKFNPCIATTSVFDSINCYNGVGVLQINVDTNGIGLGNQSYIGPRYVYTVSEISNPTGFVNLNNQIIHLLSFPTLPLDNI